jgi:hypothetical protein
MARSPFSRGPDPDPGADRGADRGVRRRRSRPTALVAVLAVAVAAGCGGGGGRGDDRGAGGGDGDESAAEADASKTTSTTTTTTVAADDGPSVPPTTAPAPAGGGDPAGGSADDCTETESWGTGARSSEPMSIDDVYLVRPGRHTCYDRVVFDVNGVVDGPESVGFHVAYADGDVRADGSGEPVPTAGAAALQVVVRAPALGHGTSGHQPSRIPSRVGDDLVTTGQVAGWPVLREVTFAGSFEGQTTFAVGVGGRLPFRAGTLEADGYTRVYVDIAHP